MAQSAKKKIYKPRNWFAVAAHFKTGAGKHTDRKKQANKHACRGKIKIDR